MSQFFDECQSYQEASVLHQNFNFKSPPLTAKIESLASTQCKFSISSDEENVYEKQNLEKRATPSFYNVIPSQFKTNSNENAFQSFFLEEIDEDEYINEFLTSSKSCQIYDQSKTNEDQNGFQSIKSLEIESNKKSYQNQLREDKVERYKLKKPKRNFDKVIRYECRKKVAVDRARVAGRFQKEPTPPAILSNLEENFVKDSQKKPKTKVCKERQIFHKNTQKKQN